MRNRNERDRFFQVSYKSYQVAWGWVVPWALNFEVPRAIE